MMHYSALYGNPRRKLGATRRPYIITFKTTATMKLSPLPVLTRLEITEMADIGASLDGEIHGRALWFVDGETSQLQHYTLFY